MGSNQQAIYQGSQELYDPQIWRLHKNATQAPALKLPCRVAVSGASLTMQRMGAVPVNFMSCIRKQLHMGISMTFPVLTFWTELGISFCLLGILTLFPHFQHAENDVFTRHLIL